MKSSDFRKTLLGIAILLVLGLGYLMLPADDTDRDSTTVSTATDKPFIPEVDFSPEELEGYYKSYENPHSIALRTALNSYLNGKTDALHPDGGMRKSTVDDKGVIHGLPSFSSDYYRSRFVIFAVNDGYAGGQFINILFVDKPDKQFIAWVKETAYGYELLDFYQDPNANEDQVAVNVMKYAKFLADEKHSL